MRVNLKSSITSSISLQSSDGTYQSDRVIRLFAGSFSNKRNRDKICIYSCYCRITGRRVTLRLRAGFNLSNSTKLHVCAVASLQLQCYPIDVVAPKSPRWRQPVLCVLHDRLEIQYSSFKGIRALVRIRYAAVYIEGIARSLSHSLVSRIRKRSGT